MAEKLVATAEQAERKGDTARASDLYPRAASVYRLARFPTNRSPLSQEAWEESKAAYIKGGQYLSPPSMPVDIPFTRADEPAGDRNVPILGPWFTGSGAAVGTYAHELSCVSGINAQRWCDTGSGLRNIPALSKALARFVERDVRHGFCRYGGWWIPHPLFGLHAPNTPATIIHLAATISYRL
jgi:hypothetical protein